jgi:hypothetical protein
MGGVALSAFPNMDQWLAGCLRASSSDCEITLIFSSIVPAATAAALWGPIAASTTGCTACGCNAVEECRAFVAPDDEVREGKRKKEACEASCRKTLEESVILLPG